MGIFGKLLVANRGEIAIRIIRAAREMGISTVAVFSEADRDSLHVRFADEAYCIGPPPSTQSYLAIEKIIDAAIKSGCEAIHPGYGFLAENPAFARSCQEAGLSFIGPPVSGIELMGSKTAARNAAIKCGVAIVPGARFDIEGDEEAFRLAREIGYPVVVKASAGGGGKGMRVVDDEDEMKSALRAARSEAESAFGDPSIYIEKYLEKPRHIEIQVLGDKYGRVIYLGERECSVQRRHQKVIEESPSPLVDSEMRRRMGEAALKICAEVGYYSAGTVEFLVDKDRAFFFLEMNTRLQVEHPVTELVTGVDLAKEMIKIASGDKLSFSQEDIRMTGHAIECRIYAEDPEADFLPSPGKITVLRTPEGPGVRVDGGVYQGYEVPLYYDPLIAKVVTWGRDREEARLRMARALREYVIGGIKTTISFHEAVMLDGEFAAGHIDTGFIERFLAREPGSKVHVASEVVAIAAAVNEFINESKSRGARPAGARSKFAANNPGDAWRLAGRRALLNSRL